MNQFKIGDVKITRIIESEAPWPGTWLIPNATLDNVKKEADWLYPTFSDEKGKLRMSIHALVIESQGKRIIVDTCIGNEKVRSNAAWNNLQTPFLSDLEKAGFTRDKIDHVICTHLHVDHVGWNTMLKNGKWVPTFTNAQYLIGGTEWDYWSKSDVKDMRDPVEDSVRPVIEDGMAKLVESNHRVTGEVWLEPTPGHTPGHHSVRISSNGVEAVITGDLMHHPIQCRYPEWDDTFDSDGAQAKKTRRAFCEKYADSGVLVFGTHFATPSAGKIVKKDDSFRFVA
ncbi:MAG: MBL fold metallo-hydrolase [Candidatus Binatus sp.]|uniref:MBL fold metallo-hydrolase n=1 Tax=Candidatus Binatus sp. TaxID=2811406 RepID=UPI0027243DC1|nr:MBL fold metallo-hydrolase [Candidatus Binatus sp.]MDO8433208.1 MBL fold metallo-hydrolase [Candidatus Binatus sp.]